MTVTASETAIDPAINLKRELHIVQPTGPNRLLLRSLSGIGAVEPAENRPRNDFPRP
jgi:hypothetical protein